jgi:rare lipoprotein A
MILHHPTLLDGLTRCAILSGDKPAIWSHKPPPPYKQPTFIDWRQEPLIQINSCFHYISETWRFADGRQLKYSSTAPSTFAGCCVSRQSDHMHDHHSARPLAALDSRGFSEILCSSFDLTPSLAVSRRISNHCSAFAKRATIAKSHAIATALLQLILLEPTRADDVKSDECGLASDYSTLSEEMASGQDTSVNDRTAAHRSLPFRTLVRVDNQKNGHSAIVRITDPWPLRQRKNSRCIADCRT